MPAHRTGQNNVSKMALPLTFSRSDDHIGGILCITHDVIVGDHTVRRGAAAQWAYRAGHHDTGLIASDFELR